MKWPSRILNLQPARTGQEIRFQTLDDDLCPHGGIPNGFLAPLQDGMVILGRKTLVVDQIQMGEGYFTAYDDGLSEDWFTQFEALEAAHDMSAKV